VAKRNVQQTSILAFFAINNLGERQRQVYQVLSDQGAACNAELSMTMGLPINQITPRVKELRDKGLVEEAYRGVWEPTNKTVIYWRVASAL
jgi:predicted transcriptional regulator